MRRTGKLSFSPRPLWPVTRPAKTWVRSFSPSLTRVCTLTESPTLNAVCFLICSPSIFSMSFIVVLVELGFFQQVRANLLGALQALLVIPLLDLAVMAGEENFG